MFVKILHLNPVNLKNTKYNQGEEDFLVFYQKLEWDRNRIRIRKGIKEMTLKQMLKVGGVKVL